MQVTGNNNRPYVYNAKLSIRLRQDGQFCSLDEAEGQQQIEPSATIEVVVDGAVCVPYPRREEGRIDLRALMSDAGLPVAEADGVVRIANDGPVAYALWIEAEQYGRLVGLAERSGAELRFTTPLCAVVARAVVGSRHDKCVVVSRSTNTLYVAYTEGRRLLYAEALPLTDNADEDMLYVMAVLNGDFDLRRADIIIIGMGAKEHYKVLRRYFRRCKCE